MQQVTLIDHLHPEQVALRAALGKPRLGVVAHKRVAPQRTRGGGARGDLGEHGHPENSAAAVIVSSICSSVCASEGMAASNCDGAR